MPGSDTLFFVSAESLPHLINPGELLVVPPDENVQHRPLEHVISIPHPAKQANKGANKQTKQTSKQAQT